jgi:hypothetical protein
MTDIPNRGCMGTTHLCETCGYDLLLGPGNRKSKRLRRLRSRFRRRIRRLDPVLRPLQPGNARHLNLEQFGRTQMRRPRQPGRTPPRRLAATQQRPARPSPRHLPQMQIRRLTRTQCSRRMRMPQVPQRGLEENLRLDSVRRGETFSRGSGEAEWDCRARQRSKSMPRYSNTSQGD